MANAFEIVENVAGRIGAQIESREPPGERAMARWAELLREALACPVNDKPRIKITIAKKDKAYLEINGVAIPCLSLDVLQNARGGRSYRIEIHSCAVSELAVEDGAT